jgi:hypothetical protein
VGLGDESKRKVVAAIVYVVGVMAVLFAAYLHRVEPNAAAQGRLVLLGRCLTPVALERAEDLIEERAGGKRWRA